MKFSNKPVFKILLILLALAVFIAGAFCFYGHKKTKKYIGVIDLASEKYSVEKALIMAIIRVESNFNSEAVSNKGAVGLMQLMPETARFISEKHGESLTDLNNAECNVLLGTAYVKYLADKFSDTDVMLAAYNAGEGRVLNWLKDERYSDDGKTLRFIPFKETRRYINKVNFYKKLYLFYFTI